jgi:hypothetical protein
MPGASSPRPGFFRVLWELIIGCLFTLIALLLPIAGLAYLGVFDWNTAGVREWPLRGPYPPDGVWATSADVFCALVVIATATVLIAGSMEATLKLPVSRPVVAVVVAVTGVSPFLYAQLLPASGPVSLLVATFLIRRFAIDRFAQRSLRPSWWLLSVLLGGGVLGVAVTVTFGVTHPLWAKTAYFNGDDQLAFTLHNAGLADVTIVSLSEPAQLTFPLDAHHRIPPVAGTVIRGHGSREIVLKARGCPAGNLSVRYRISGRLLSVRLRPQPHSLRLHC